MKNLSLWQVTSKKLTDLHEAWCICYDHKRESDTIDFFVCSESLIVSNIDSNGDIQWTRNLSEFLSQQNAPINITFLSINNCISLGFANGELVTIGNFGNDYDLVGECDNGLLAMEWSPDQELLVLVTKDLRVILMSCTFDPITEQSLLSDEFGDKEFVNVGWGTKETQFHGSEGKHARVKTDVAPDENPDVSDKILISWRGDGEYYAVGFLMNGIRRFKVFDKEGNLQYTSEKQAGLEANLAWRPSGNLIATTQCIEDKHIVAFFEKNGLKHGSFEIPIDSSTYVEQLIWSSDSEVLSIVCENKLENTQKILLYTMANYHWYLKQTLVFKKKLNKVMWDYDFELINNKKLHVFSQDSQYNSYTWVWNVDHSLGLSEEDDAVVAVIDGNRILLTNFKHAVIPPPLSSYDLDLDSNVNAVFFSPGNSSNTNSLAVLTETKILFLEQTVKDPVRYKITKEVDFDHDEFPLQHYNWFCLDMNTYICSKVNEDNLYEVVQYKIHDNTLLKENSNPVHLPVARAFVHPILESNAFLQLISGEILIYNNDCVSPHDISFPEACVKLSVILIDNVVTLLGVSLKGNFYIMDKLVIKDVSSYFVHTSFLLITTLQHELICTGLSKSGLNKLEFSEDKNSYGLYRRKIERGSKLVIVMPKSTLAVFQLPRGNIETIEPRPLLLQRIGEYLDVQKYHEAFTVMRKHRINLNLIFDHDPELFINNIDTFLESIDNNSWLNLFLTDLENIDVTETMYSSIYSGKNTKKPFTNKVNFICDKIRTHINASSSKAYRVLPLLTSIVKKNSASELEQALLVIKDLKTQENSGLKLPVTCDEALKYLLYMVHVDQLFDVALGMYDFELVLLVASKSQKDPKEYIPMLNELNELEENYKRYSINKYLKRFEKAVECLAKCGESRVEELRSFVKYHSLYRDALALYSCEDNTYKQIADDYGLYLKLKKQHVEAGIVFEKAGNIEKAIECYVEGLEWELAIKLAYDKPENEFNALCWNLASALKEEKRYNEAIRLLEEFTSDSEDIITFAVTCNQYKTALRLCAKYKKSELIKKSVAPALLAEYDSLQNLLETNDANFTKYKIRLQIVRKNKSKKLVEDYEPYGNRDSDLYSDSGSTVASSSGSSGSGRSFRSSKNRRKHERKMVSLKEGSQYEDLALVKALHSLITSTCDLRLYVKEINIALCCLSEDYKAVMLQICLDTFIKDMKDSFKYIWNNEFALEATKASIAAENVPEGSSVITQGIAALEPHLRIPPAIQELNWKLEGLYN